MRRCLAAALLACSRAFWVGGRRPKGSFRAPSWRRGNFRRTQGTAMGLQLDLILVAGVLALLYGAWTVRSVLSRSVGTPRMQEIAAAIQEGAAAYLNRQYTTIAVAGAVILIIAFLIFGWQVRSEERRV